MSPRRRRPIRVGVVGLRRGLSYARGATERLGFKLVALCDSRDERLQPVCQELGVTGYNDHWNPDPTEKVAKGTVKPPCSVKGVLPISKGQLAYAEKNWREQC